MILTPDDPLLAALCDTLAAQADALGDDWPAGQLRLCAEAGVYRWFVPEEQGGLGWGEADLIRGYLRLSAACLTTTFIITQLTGALRRIAAAGSDELRREWLPPLLAGERF